MRETLKALPIIISLVIHAANFKAGAISGSTLFFEVHTKDGIVQIIVPPDDIKAGIDERGRELGRDPSIGITVDQKYHAMFEKLTKENLEQKMVIRTETETIFSGTIKESIRKGQFGFSPRSSQEAEAVFKKMGREPDYRLRLTPEELELAKRAAKRYMEPFKNPWAEIAMDETTKLHPDYEKAEAYMKIAIEEGPDEDRNHLVLSLIYFRQGKMKLALKEALTAERLSSKEDLAIAPGTYLTIADLYARFNEYDKAIEYLNKVLSNDKGNRLAYFGLAEIYEKMGKYDLAIEIYSFMSRADDEPTREKALEGLSRLEEKRK